MIKLKRLAAWLFPDRRPEREIKRERAFIAAVNGLKTLSTTDRGGMSIDPEELRDQIIASREQLKYLVHKPGTPNGRFAAAADVQVQQDASPDEEPPVSVMGCIEVVAWRRLPSGAAVRYVCLQSTSTGLYAVATASLFSGDQECVPCWVDVSVNREVACNLQNAKFGWNKTVNGAMDAWDAAS